MGVDDAEGEECGKMGVVETVNTHCEGVSVFFGEGCLHLA